MATIPLVALDSRAAQEQQGPLAQYAQIQQIKAAQTQQQTAGLQQTGLEQENQIRARQIQDTETLRSLGPKHVQKDADGNVTGFDTNGLLQEAAGKGVNPQTLNKMRLDYAEAVQKSAAAGTAQIELHDKQNDQAYQILEGVRAIKDPTTREAAYQKAIPQIKNLGVAADGLPSTSDDTALQGFEAHLGVHKQVLADAKTAAETAEKNQQAATSKATQAHTEQETALGGTPAQRELQDWLAKNPGKGPSDYEIAMKKIVPAYNFNLQNQGAAADSNGNPSMIAQLLAANKMKWSEAVSMRTPQAVKDSILKQVFKLNPNFDTSEFGLEQDAAKKARSGAWADTRLAYNTALDHSDLLLKAADALDNGDSTALNTLKNNFKTAFGWSGKINYDAIANAYNHEVTSVVSKGHITDNEVASGHATLPDNVNKETIHDVVNSYRSLMTSKRDELDKIIKAGAGNKANAVINTGSSSDTTGGGKKVLSPADWLKQQKP